MPASEAVQLPGILDGQLRCTEPVLFAHSATAIIHSFEDLGFRGQVLEGSIASRDVGWVSAAITVCYL